MSTILIVDDDGALRGAIATTLTDLGHDPVEAGDGAEALVWLAGHRADAVLLDLRMPGMDGLAVLKSIRGSANPPNVAILTAVPTSENTIEAMRLGAIDHLAKPVGRADLAALIDRMLPASVPNQKSSDQAAPIGTLVGVSDGMRQVHKAIGMLADTESTVLIMGETGTGKEVVARSIHDHGKRRAGPFVAVNCAAIPPELLESELFGHVRGAFTGAAADRNGFFRDAQGGTIFLDEIGDMTLVLQAKILRVLQERVVTPLGGKPIKIDVRVIAATHRDLPAAVRSGSFREDLYYRIGVIPIVLPPLRERVADIIPLAEHFLTLAAKNGVAKGLTPDAAKRLEAHPWPGNVRELRNAMERVAAMVRRPSVAGPDLNFLDLGFGVPNGEGRIDDSLPGAVARLEIDMIRRALAAAGGNRAQAAEKLGIRRQLLYDKIARYGLESSELRTAYVPKADTLD